MKEGTKIKAEKVDHHNDELYTSEDAAAYEPGEKDRGIETGYHFEGRMLIDVEIGKPMLVERTKRLDVVASGVFRSSPVTSIENRGNHYLVTTGNSIYKVIEL